MITLEQHRPYIRWVALVTIFLYTTGYAAVGFGLLFVEALWRLVSRRSILWRRSALDMPLAAFGAVLLLSAAASPYHRLALSVTLALIVSGAVYFGSFAWLLEHNPTSRGDLLRVWALGAAVAALAGLAYSAVNYVEACHQYSATNYALVCTPVHARAQIPRGVGPNGLGTTLLLGSILAFGLSFRTRGWERTTWIFCGLLTLLGLLATGSRTSVAGWIAGAGYLVYRELRPRPWLMAAVLAGGLAVLAVSTAATPQLGARLGHTITDVSSNRIRIWRTSLRMIKAHPVLGTGFGTFEREYERRKGPGMSSEPFAFNLFLNLGVETGLLGLVAAGTVALAAVGAWWSSSPSPSSGVDAYRSSIAALWAGLLVDQLADNTLFSISTSAALWLLLVLTVVSPRRAERGAPIAQQPADHRRTPPAAPCPAFRDVSQ